MPRRNVLLSVATITAISWSWGAPWVEQTSRQPCRSPALPHQLFARTLVKNLEN